ncbi:MAG TPA: DHH family phosphoesterase [Roseiflexaceae bacterium]|nr:DHH family phosphoesterase [Roseiflexaceae bacterium]
MIITDPAQAAPAFRTALAAARRALLLTHINPDGDAVGSLMAMWHALRALGTEAVPVLLPPLPSYTLWLPGLEHALLYQQGMQIPPCDLVIMLDTATPARTGAAYEDRAAELSHLPLIVIDHHVTNEGGGALNLIDPRAASTCELLFGLLRALGAPISPDTATCLLLGHTTDTQSYQTSSTSPAALRVAADLLELGASHASVVREVYYALPGSSAHLIGKALADLHVRDGVAWTTVTRAMMAETGAEEEAADEVLRVMQRIGEVRVMALFKERSDGTTKLSLRSRAPLNVALLAQRWGGGGHAQAAGATLLMPPTQAEAEVLPLLCTLAGATETRGPREDPS